MYHLSVKVTKDKEVLAHLGYSSFKPIIAECERNMIFTAARSVFRKPTLGNSENIKKAVEVLPKLYNDDNVADRVIDGYTFVLKKYRD